MRSVLTPSSALSTIVHVLRARRPRLLPVHMPLYEFVCVADDPVRELRHLIGRLQSATACLLSTLGALMVI